MALSTRVLHLLGDKGPLCPQPTQFIRYMYVQQSPLRLGDIRVCGQSGYAYDAPSH